MATDKRFRGDDPRRYTHDVRALLEDAGQQARRYVDRVDDSKAKALLQTAADGVLGLAAALEHYETRTDAVRQ